MDSFTNVSDKASFVSARDREKFAHDGYLYTFDRFDSTERIKFWRCDKRTAHHCKARLHTSVATNKVLKQVNDHSHAPDGDRVEIAAVCTSIIRQVQETKAKPQMVVKEAFRHLPFPTRRKMPTRKAMWVRVQRLMKKRAANGEPLGSQPVDRAAIVVPKAYRTHKDGDGFLLYDTGLGDHDRILIFGRLSNGAWSNCMKNLVANATLDIESSLFPHVFVLMAERGFFIPVLFALLPDKQEATYRRMFSAAKEMWPDLAPESVSMDFDQAAMNAVCAVFPNANAVGCFVHLVRRMKTKLVEKGLLEKYNTDTEFARSVRMVLALAFVPLDAIEKAFSEFSSKSPKALGPILDWFEEDYLGLPNHFGSRRIPPFPPRLWSVYDKMLMGEYLTNELVNAASRRISSEFAVAQPTTWKFVDRIRALQEWSDQLYEDFEWGKKPPKRRLQFVEADKRIQQLVKQFDSDRPVEFLRSMADNFATEF
ncbi:FLYWCH and MULE domain containing protein [Trichuris trichiura]|uniref:FLYWCH and MULE domain containing protein n=1 Tax=Trichuris trichiura TaxID=36087 RepID=A0A077Z4V8_TRITR|nr:FLYWCH and MULE domain containing protein [Trichuris trichiura]